MDTIRLRTLAKKSILGFGKYYDNAVQELIALKHTRYLRWVYYNCSMISFNNEILNEINITSEYRIEKPGTNPEMNEYLNKLLKMRMHGKLKLKNKSHNMKLKRDEINRSRCRNIRKENKNMDRLRNQGHKV